MRMRRNSINWQPERSWTGWLRKMSLYLIFSIVGSGLTACATVTPDPWQIDVDTNRTIRCDSLPDIPVPDIEGDAFVYDREGVQALDEYFTLAKACEQIAAAHASQIDELKKAAYDLVEAGKAQRRVADLRAEILREERKRHVVEKVSLYAIILAGLGAASL